MGIIDHGTNSQPLSAPSLAAWAASVADILGNSDAPVNDRIAAALGDAFGKSAMDAAMGGDVAGLVPAVAGKRGKGDLAINVIDYASPQAAITSAQALASPVRVKFGKGTYTIGASLNVTASDITLDLESACLVTTFAGAAITVTGTSGTPLERVRVVGGTIDLNSVGITGIVATYCTTPRIEDVTVRNGTTAAGAAVSLVNCTSPLVGRLRANSIGSGVGLSYTTDAVISECSFVTMQRDGVTAYNGSHRTTVSGCSVYGYNHAAETGRAGIHIYGSNGASVTGCVVNSGTATGTNDSPKIRFRDALDFACSGNLCQGLGGGGIAAVALSDIGSGAGKGSITGNTIRDVQGSGVNVYLASAGVATSLYPVSVVGNTIMGVRQVSILAGSGIAINAGADSTVVSSNLIEDLDGEGITIGCNGVVVGNTIRQIGKGTLGSKAAIFVLSGTVAVTGNHVFDDAATPTTANGLRVIAGATARTAGNLFRNAISAAVRNDGTIEAQLGEISSALIGFYGTAPIAKQTGTPAAATDLTTTTALVNSLRSKLIALGLIG